LSSTTDLIMQMMLGRMGQSGASVPNMSDMIANLAQRDPRMAPLVQQLQARLAERQPAVDQPGEESSIDTSDPEIVQPPRHSEGEQPRRLSTAMLAEMSDLRARNDLLAEALGACHLCWGEDADCSYCAGDGCIGSFQIDTKVFRKVIGPAVKQVMQRPPQAKPEFIDKGEVTHAGL
jgi:hypothetical protein